MASEISAPTSASSTTHMTSTSHRHYSLHNHPHPHQHYQQPLRHQRHHSSYSEAFPQGYYNTPPQISRPQSARLYNHQTHRSSPQWPYDHRGSDASGYGVYYPQIKAPSNPSLPSQPRRTSLPVKAALATYNGIPGEERSWAAPADLRIPSRATIRDSEKGHGSMSPVQHFSPVEPLRSSYSHIITPDLEAANGHESDYTKQTLKALIHLGLSNPFTSLMACVYTIFTLFYVFLTIPFHLCSSDPAHSAAARSIRYLIRPLNLQRRCISLPHISIHSTSPKARTEGSITSMASTTHDLALKLPCKTSALIFTHLLSPFLSLPLALGAWCTAFAWLPSAMLSHERTAGVSDDERRMAERLVGMWSRWLDWCVVDVDEERRGRRRRRRQGERGRR